MNDVPVWELLFIVVTLVGAPLSVARILFLCGLWKPDSPTESQLPVDSIDKIHQSAVFMIAELQKQIDRRTEDREVIPDWPGPILEFYRRLEALASSPSVTEDQARELSNDASRYIREHRIKGVFVALEASRLAELLRENQSPNSKNVQ